MRVACLSLTERPLGFAVVGMSYVALPSTKSVAGIDEGVA